VRASAIRREPGRSALSNHHEKPGLRTIGISLVELLVTIGIIAILTALFAYCGTGAGPLLGTR
jgi:type II secretory pathway pseudopilin PulG